MGKDPTVEINVDPLQRHAVPFVALIIVEGAPTGAEVIATLEQTRGRPSLWGPESKAKRAGDTGNLVFDFDVVMQGPADTELKAIVVDDKGTNYPPAFSQVEVLAPPPPEDL